MWKSAARCIWGAVYRTCDVFDLSLLSAARRKLRSSVRQRNQTQVEYYIKWYPLCPRSAAFYSERKLCWSSWDKAKYKEPPNWDFCAPFFCVLLLSNVIVAWDLGRMYCIHSRDLPEDIRLGGYRFHPMLVEPAKLLHLSIVFRFVASAPGDSFADSVLVRVNDNNVHGLDESGVTNEDPIISKGQQDPNGEVSVCAQLVDASTDTTTINPLSRVGAIEFELGLQNWKANKFKDAAFNFQSAAVYQHAGAMFALGLCFESGKGEDKDLKKAVSHYRSASELGHPKAMYNLAVLHFRGLGGLRKDHREAFKWFTAAAATGLPEAQLALEMKKNQKNPADVAASTKEFSG